MRSADCPIVGIGASAGGLEALKALLQGLPEDSGAAFVVIQHLDPDRQSMIAEILARATTMPVTQITDGMAVEADHVYAIPPNSYLTLSGNTLKLGDPAPRHGLRMPIDAFFWSLAEQRHERAIGIIVSGTGSDGTLGLRAIKGNGGLVLAQSPETAQFDGMPRSAIATGLVDVVCDTGEMPAHLVSYLRHPYVEQASTRRFEDLPEDDERQMHSILAILQTRTGCDFRAYKRGTIARRIARRMSLHHITDLHGYVNFIREHPEEVAALNRDLLIGVTAFFRDPEAFDALDVGAVASLVERKGAEEPIRVWVPGCASGEEAYSIAMLFLERLERAHRHSPLQVFATDLDEAALAVARAGLYPDNVLASIPAARLQRFFVKEEHGYRVCKSLREAVTFAQQNVISDPPFSRLDLISCRNLLIYLEAEVQQRILALFHFALRDGGFLLLGHSETVGQSDGLFEPVARNRRLYRRTGVRPPTAPTLPVSPSRRGSGVASDVSRAGNTQQLRLHELAQAQLLRDYAPAAVLLNAANQALYFLGPTARYLEQPTGAPTIDIWSLVRYELRAPLRAALKQVAEDGHRSVVAEASVIRERRRVRVRLTVRPLSAPGLPAPLFLVTFEDEPAEAVPAPVSVPIAEGSQASLIQQLEYDLEATREELQTNIEELESANEELQAANEEVMSVNEELQSSNEELETSKEELQSMNEELTTVNAQLTDKVEELATTNDDLANLLSSTHIATLFLDTELRIGRFTPATRRLLNVIATDVGRPIADIRPKFADGDLLADARRVLETLAPLESEVCTDEGETYLRRILPYRAGDNRIGGVVVTFVDITERKRREKDAQRLAALVKDSNDAITSLDLDGTITAWNRGAVRMYGCSESQALGTSILDTVVEEDRDTFLDRLRRAADGDPPHGFESRRVSRSGQTLEVSVTATPLRDRAGRVTSLATTERDVTERNRSEAALRRSEQNLRMLIDAAPDAMLVVDAAGVIEVANAQAERLLGHTKEQLLGLDVEALLPSRYRAAHVGHRQSFFSGPRVREMGSGMELYCLTRDGRELPIEVSLSPIDTDRGLRVSASIRDISERKQAEERVRDARTLAESANAAKSRFLATASHDLRQPLQSLKLLNAALLRSIGEAKAREMLRTQDEALRGMSRLLASLLDISKLDSGAVFAAPRDFALRPLLEQLCAEFRAEAAEKGLSLALETPDVFARSDPGLLSQLLQNLLANAIRYTEKGGLTVACARHADRLRISVTDTGIGIPADELETIFAEFHQVNRRPDDGYRGLGLGLAIVQRIAALLGTTVRVSSEPGVGSCFSLDVPPGAETPDQPAPRKEPDTGAAAGGATILVVEDDPAVLEASRVLLTIEGYDVVVAASAAQARKLLDGLRPDVVLTDLHLEDGASGVDIVRLARERAGREVPAVLITGDTSTEVARLDLGNTCVMIKPLDVEELLAEIRTLLKVEHVRQHAAR